MKYSVLVVLWGAILSFSCGGAEVVWDCLGFHVLFEERTASGELYTSTYQFLGPISPSPGHLEFNGDGTYSFFSAVAGPMTLYVEASRRANYGDIINREMILDATDYYYRNNIFGDGECTWTGIDNLLPEENFYLAFAQGDFQNPSDVVYGWAEFYISQNGELSLLHSAYDRSGGPMITGGGAYVVPEPATSLLYFIGFSLLGLRRRN